MFEVIAGGDRGRYPDGNSLVVWGTSERVLIDPSLTVAANPPAGIDRILASHCHEDHLAGLFQFPHAPVHVHEADLPGLESIDRLMGMYGLPPALDAAWRREVEATFHYRARPDAQAFADGAVFDLGGVTIRAVHLPGHTPGHTGFLVEPDGVLFVADIDLTSFGPYYGDACSTLDDFERSIARCREIEAGTYVTFHHRGVVRGRASFLSLLDDYTAVIDRRERDLQAFLREPKTLDDIVARRFVYRPHVQLPFVDAVERRSAELHLERLLARGLAQEVEPGRFGSASRESRMRA